MRVGGYFMPIAIARELGNHLGLRVGDDTMIFNVHLQSIFNNWLAENQKFHILAAAISWPSLEDGSDYGIIFISKFVRGGSADESLKEDGKALDVKKEIKGWDLSRELQLQWVSFPDRYGITMRGTRPRLNETVLIRRSFDEMMAIANAGAARKL